MMFPLFSKNVTLEIVYVISVNYLIKLFPYLVKHAVFSAIKIMKKTKKTASKLALHHMEKIFFN